MELSPETLSNLAPSVVYLIGLVAALRHIHKLYEARIGEIKSGHEERFKLLEQSSKECYEDRNILRKELGQLRDRLLLQGQRGSAADPDE